MMTMMMSSSSSSWCCNPVFFKEDVEYSPVPKLCFHIVVMSTINFVLRQLTYLYFGLPYTFLSVSFHRFFSHVIFYFAAAPGGGATSGVFPGMFRTGGIQVLTKKKSLQHCIQRCLSSNVGGTVCFAIDYDFHKHKCFLHTVMANVCPAGTSLAAKPEVVHIAYCPA